MNTYSIIKAVIEDGEANIPAQAQENLHACFQHVKMLVMADNELVIEG